MNNEDENRTILELSDSRIVQKGDMKMIEIITSIDMRKLRVLQIGARRKLC